MLAVFGKAPKQRVLSVSPLNSMKQSIVFRHLLASLALTTLSASALQAETVVYSGAFLEALTMSGMDVSVSSGDQHRLMQEDGSYVTIMEDSTYKVETTGNGGIRILLRSGQAVFLPILSAKQPSQIEFVAAGSVIEADGAELKLNIDQAGVELVHTSSVGEIRVDGREISAREGKVLEKPSMLAGKD